MTGQPTEIEFKLAALRHIPWFELTAALESTGVAIAAGGVRSQRDVYLDDSDFAIARSGAGLRVREFDDRRLICWKGASVVEGAAVRRLEIEESWPAGAELPQHTDELPDALREHVPGELELRHVIQLDTARERAVLGLDGSEAELSSDLVAASAPGGATATFAEVELEVLRGESGAWSQIVAALRAKLDLRESTESKFARALRLCGVTMS